MIRDPGQPRESQRTLAHRLRAFSLLEVTLVIAMIGIVSMVAIPRLNNSLARARAKQAAMRLVADLSLAQERASALSASQTFTFTDDPATYEIDGMMDPDHDAKRYIVDLSREPYSVRFKSIDLDGEREVVFNGHGALNRGGKIVIAAGSAEVTVSLSAETGRASFR